MEYYLNILTTKYKGRVTGSKTCYESGEWIYSEFKNMSNLIVKKQSWSKHNNLLWLKPSLNLVSGF